MTRSLYLAYLLKQRPEAQAFGDRLRMCSGSTYKSSSLAMIGACAYYLLERGISHAADMDIDPSLSLG